MDTPDSRLGSDRYARLKGGLTNEQRHALVDWLCSEDNDGGWNVHSAKESAWAVITWLERTSQRVVPTTATVLFPVKDCTKEPWCCASGGHEGPCCEPIDFGDNAEVQA